MRSRICPDVEVLPLCLSVCLYACACVVSGWKQAPHPGCEMVMLLPSAEALSLHPVNSHIATSCSQCPCQWSLTPEDLDHLDDRLLIHLHLDLTSPLCDVRKQTPCHTVETRTHPCYTWKYTVTSRRGPWVDRRGDCQKTSIKPNDQ